MQPALSPSGKSTSLSGRQFPSSLTSSLGYRPQPTTLAPTPLPLSAAVSNSAQAAAAWRPPQGQVLSYSPATSTSTFKPWGTGAGDASY